MKIPSPQANLCLRHKAHHDAITALKLKQREDEGALKQTEVRLKKLDDQLEGLIAQKERAAKELEIVHAKEKKGELEDANCNLQVHLKSGKIVRVLVGYGDPELQWVATVLRRALRVPRDAAFGL